MSSSTSPPHPRNSVTLSVNKHRRATYTVHGIRDTDPEYGALFSRDTGHKSTGYEARYSRDTRHRRGIRGTDFTGYETQKKYLKWLETLAQQALQDCEKIN